MDSRGSPVRQSPAAVAARRIAAGLLLGLVPWLAGGGEVPRAIYLVNEDDRITASNAETGQFFDLRISAREKVVAQHVADGVAVVISNQRFAGIGTFSGGWHSIRRIAAEQVVRTEVQDYSALLVTSDRLLSFNGRTGSWSQTKR